jgi:Na+-transporting NADH:ubiquinone oxidoreductase subunit NqrF
LQPTIISRANEAPAKRDLLFESAANHAKQIGALGKGVMLIAGTLADGQAQTDVKVRVDGKTIDILPTELELTDGNHEVTSGYRTIGAVKVEQGKAIKVTVSYNDLRID